MPAPAHAEPLPKLSRPGCGGIDALDHSAKMFDPCRIHDAAANILGACRLRPNHVDRPAEPYFGKRQHVPDDVLVAGRHGAAVQEAFCVYEEFHRHCVMSQVGCEWNRCAGCEIGSDAAS